MIEVTSICKTSFSDKVCWSWCSKAEQTVSKAIVQERIQGLQVIRGDGLCCWFLLCFCTEVEQTESCSGSVLEQHNTGDTTMQVCFTLASQIKQVSSKGKL